MLLSTLRPTPRPTIHTSSRLYRAALYYAVTREVGYQLIDTTDQLIDTTDQLIDKTDQLIDTIDQLNNAAGWCGGTASTNRKNYFSVSKWLTNVLRRTVGRLHMRPQVGNRQ